VITASSNRWPWALRIACFLTQFLLIGLLGPKATAQARPFVRDATSAILGLISSNRWTEAAAFLDTKPQIQAQGKRYDEGDELTNGRLNILTYTLDRAIPLTEDAKHFIKKLIESFPDLLHARTGPENEPLALMVLRTYGFYSQSSDETELEESELLWDLFVFLNELGHVWTDPMSLFTAVEKLETLEKLFDLAVKTKNKSLQNALDHTTTSGQLLVNELISQFLYQSENDRGEHLRFLTKFFHRPDPTGRPRKTFVNSVYPFLFQRPVTGASGDIPGRQLYPGYDEARARDFANLISVLRDAGASEDRLIVLALEQGDIRYLRIMVKEALGLQISQVLNRSLRFVDPHRLLPIQFVTMSVFYQVDSESLEHFKGFIKELKINGALLTQRNTRGRTPLEYVRYLKSKVRHGLIDEHFSERLFRDFNRQNAEEVLGILEKLFTTTTESVDSCFDALKGEVS
jgi:hypothetical protein